MDLNRLPALQQWVNECLNKKFENWLALPGDAGFRRYYRFYVEGKSYIAVDAPLPASENRAFVAVDKGFAAQGIVVPELHHYCLQQGFFMLSDLGKVLLADKLSHDCAETLYRKAFTTLFTLQRCQVFPKWQLPKYDAAFLHQECQLFTHWFLQQHCQLRLTDLESQQLQALYEKLVQSALAQPQVCVHRDYHSRNLMLCVDGRLAVIDFQGALLGPITYDVVSLLRDSYVQWPEKAVRQWSRDYCQQAIVQGLLTAEQREFWDRWFDWMGLQRHIKVAGIFSRLYHRDNKSRYLANIPNTLQQLVLVSQLYPELSWFAEFITQRVMPHLPIVEPTAV